MKRKIFVFLLSLIPSLAIQHSLQMKFVSNNNSKVVQGENNSNGGW